MGPPPPHREIGWVSKYELNDAPKERYRDKPLWGASKVVYFKLGQA